MNVTMICSSKEVKTSKRTGSAYCVATMGNIGYKKDFMVSTEHFQEIEEGKTYNCSVELSNKGYDLIVDKLKSFKEVK